MSSTTSERPPAPVPDRPSTRKLKQAVQTCRACDLWQGTTQAVLGEGDAHAKLMLVGEQPGDREDIEGHPFVGPAGRVLDQGLDRAGIAREETYVTNVVKHFRSTHPSAILRARDQQERREAMDAFVSDLSNVARWLGER